MLLSERASERATGNSTQELRQQTMSAVAMVLPQLCGLVVAALVLVWALGFRSNFSFSSNSPSSAHLDQLYSVLHPLLMVIGFILLSGEAILVHRCLTNWSRATRKTVHLVLQGAALGLGLSGIWAKFKGNFYSLHSWMGFTCIVLFAAQWLVGFLSFCHRGEGRWSRAVVLPWHVCIGLYTYVLAVATAETGLIEKLTFLQTKNRVDRRSPESTLVNALGVGLALLCGFVIFAAISPKHNRNAVHQYVLSNYNKNSKDSSLFVHSRVLH